MQNVVQFVTHDQLICKYNPTSDFRTKMITRKLLDVEMLLLEYFMAESPQSEFSTCALSAPKVGCVSPDCLDVRKMYDVLHTLKVQIQAMVE